MVRLQLMLVVTMETVMLYFIRRNVMKRFPPPQKKEKNANKFRIKSNISQISLPLKDISFKILDIYMSHFAYACKMRYPLNIVLESWEYLWFYWTFCIVI